MLNFHFLLNLSATNQCMYFFFLMCNVNINMEACIIIMYLGGESQNIAKNAALMPHSNCLLYCINESTVLSFGISKLTLM